LTLVCSALSLLSCRGGSGPPPSAPGAPRVGRPIGNHIRFSFRNVSKGPASTVPTYVIFTCTDGSGRFYRLDRTGRFRLCSPADNVVAKDGRTWCDYGIALKDTTQLDIDRDQAVDSGRIYLSIGSPLFLRVDEITGGLVQPDPANPTDPNRNIPFDWIELAIDGAGFHGNTTCVDQFGLPMVMTVFDRADPKRAVGRVGFAESRSALFKAYRASLPAAFAALADPQDLRILAPAHGGFGAAGPDRDYLQGYIDQMWVKYRLEPLVLTPDEGTFTGRVDPQGRIVFTRDGDDSQYVIQGKPSSLEAFLGNGVLAQGNGIEKVLGAQLAAMLNRHVLEAPLSWRVAADYYRREPCNRYAQFWHEHGLNQRAYGFSYDDVNDQSPSLATAQPLEIRITYRWD
jgi:hypothetical protein